MPTKAQAEITKSIVHMTALAVLLAVLMALVLLNFLNASPHDYWVSVPLAILIPLIVIPIASFRYLKVVRLLSAANKKLEILSRFDNLTNIYNRRSFYELARMERALLIRKNLPVSLLMFDFDNFKKINDAYGHSAGDEVLKSGIKEVKAILRSCDIFGRYGGEEFIVFLPSTEPPDAEGIAERIREAIQSTLLTVDDQKIPFTVSVGCVSELCANATIDDLTKFADSLLYEAKRKGRNRVESSVISEPSLEQFCHP